MLRSGGLERKLAWKARYFNNYITRPAFQKWCHEMITTFIVRQKVESLDKKHDKEVVSQAFAEWIHISKSKSLRQYKTARLKEKFWSRSLSAVFVLWSHFTYRRVTVQRVETSLSRRLVGICWHVWSSRSRKFRGGMLRFGRRNAIRRRLMRAKYLHACDLAFRVYVQAKYLRACVWF